MPSSCDSMTYHESETNVPLFSFFIVVLSYFSNWFWSQYSLIHFSRWSSHSRHVSSLIRNIVSSYFRVINATCPSFMLLGRCISGIFGPTLLCQCVFSAQGRPCLLELQIWIEKIFLVSVFQHHLCDVFMYYSTCHIVLSIGIGRWNLCDNGRLLRELYESINKVHKISHQQYFNKTDSTTVHICGTHYNIM